MTVGLTAGCLVIEMIIVGWQRSSLYKLTHQSRNVSGDIFAFLFELTGLYQLVGILFYGGLFYFIYGQIQKHVHFHLIALIDSTIIQVVIMLVVTDLKDYVMHWIMHRAGWVWELHKFHHSATDMTMLTSFRSHAAEVVVADFLGVIVFITLGVPAETYLILTLLNQAHQRFKHSQIRSDWGWIGEYILVSPAAHQLHHSTDPAHHGKNLGTRCIIWDKLFGTYYRPDKTIQYQFGLIDEDFNKKPYLRGYVQDIFRSYIRSLKVAKDSFLGLFRSSAKEPSGEV